MQERLSFGECAKNNGAFKALTLFLILVCGDIALVALHFINTFVFAVPVQAYNIEQDRGLSEFYQYLKYLWIVVLFSLLSANRKTINYIPWAAVFIYFLLDDSLQIHENAGLFFAAHFDFEPLFGLRPRDLGELLVTATVGSFLFIPLCWAFWNGDKPFRLLSTDVFILIAIFVGFGVGVDMIHVMLDFISWEVTYLLGVVEDGGEMITASMMVFYMYYQTVIKGNRKLYICKFIQKRSCAF